MYDTSPKRQMLSYFYTHTQNLLYILCCKIDFSLCLGMSEMEKTVRTRQIEIQRRNGS